MKKILMLVCIMLLVSMTAFAGEFDLLYTVKQYLTIENVLACIGLTSVIMTGVPVPKPDTFLYRLYGITKYLSGNFGFADHTKKK